MRVSGLPQCIQLEHRRVVANFEGQLKAVNLLRTLSATSDARMIAANTAFTKDRRLAGTIETDSVWFIFAYHQAWSARRAQKYIYFHRIIDWCSLLVKREIMFRPIGTRDEGHWKPRVRSGHENRLLFIYLLRCTANTSL